MGWERDTLLSDFVLVLWSMIALMPRDYCDAVLIKCMCEKIKTHISIWNLCFFLCSLALVPYFKWEEKKNKGHLKMTRLTWVGIAIGSPYKEYKKNGTHTQRSIETIQDNTDEMRKKNIYTEQQLKVRC